MLFSILLLLSWVLAYHHVAPVDRYEKIWYREQYWKRFWYEDEIDLEGKICLFFELITPLW